LLRRYHRRLHARCSTLRGLTPANFCISHHTPAVFDTRHTLWRAVLFILCSRFMRCVAVRLATPLIHRVYALLCTLVTHRFPTVHFGAGRERRNFPYKLLLPRTGRTWTRRLPTRTKPAFGCARARTQRFLRSYVTRPRLPHLCGFFAYLCRRAARHARTHSHCAGCCAVLDVKRTRTAGG